MGNQTVTSEVMKKFHSRFAEIFYFDEPLGKGNYLNFHKTLVKIFINFASILFDYRLISWVTNNTMIYNHYCILYFHM